MDNKEKEELIRDLKETMKDFSRLGKKLLNPFLDFVEKRYESLSPEKKQKVQNTVDILKTKKENGIKSIKDFLFKTPKKP